MEQRPVRTGDALIFSSNTSTGFALRTFTSSLWNHSGIAIRITDDGRITLDDTGKMYILEINTWERLDAITGEPTVGAGYSDYDWACKRYNITGVRRLKDEYRQKSIIPLIEAFVNKNRGREFTTDIEPFLSVWLGVKLSSDVDRNTMFCSEFMSYFYMEILGYSDLVHVLGKSVPTPQLCAPKHFSYEFTPTAPIFEKRDEIINRRYCDAGPCFIPILIITFFLVIVLWSTLPRK